MPKKADHAKNSAHERSDCPVSVALDVLGDRWTLLVVRDLMFSGKCHFREMLASDEKIASNILAERLKRLECHGIVTKREDPANRTRFIYGLTGKGLALAPVLLEMIRWNANHDPATRVGGAYRKRLQNDTAGLISEMRSGIHPARSRDL